MLTKPTALLLGVTLLLCFSCSQKKPDILGMWTVQKVSMGSQEVTPVGRWVEFKENYTHQGGNGWYPHAIGTYSYDGEFLEMETSNGLNDLAPPFAVELNDSTMVWNRIEEGENVKVILQRSKAPPTVIRDQIIGAWNSIDTADYTLFFRWDRVYTKTMPSGKVEYGIYKVHAHRPEIECVAYGKPEFKRYSIAIDKNQLSLTSLQDSSTHHFLQTNQKK